MTDGSELTENDRSFDVCCSGHAVPVPCYQYTAGNSEISLHLSVQPAALCTGYE